MSVAGLPKPPKLLGRKIAFWGAVAGVSVLSQFGLELLARKVPLTGLQRFVAFTHCGPGKDS